MKQICRVCLQEGKCTFDIHDQKLNIGEIIRQHLPFDFPDEYVVVCATCWHKMDAFHQFYISVQDVQTNYWQQQSVSCDVVVKMDNNPLYEPEVAQVDGETEKPSISTSDSLRIPSEGAEFDNEEYVDEDSLVDDNEDDEDYTAINDFLDEDDSDNDVDFESANVEEENDDDDPDYKSSKRKSTHKRKHLSKSSNVEKAKEKKVKRTITRQQIRPKCNLTDAEILKKHITMLCDICCFVGNTFADLCTHIDVEHSVIPYVVCCDRKIKKHHRLVQHAYKHEDPNIYKCESCDKNFFDAYTFKSHMISNHPQEEELKFQCDKCEKRFSRQHLLNCHIPTHIPPEERTFVCDKCPDGKTFGSNRLLQIHVSMTHKKTTNICHVCAKEIRDLQAFKKHVRLHFEDSGPRVKCPQPGCDSWLKDKDNLKQHLRRHNIEGKIYSCPQCNKVCKNRSALTGHLRYAHTDSEFICDVCQKSFRKAITLKEHMAQHTGESLYKCPFCTRTFNSSANMHSHKKKMHPVEWDLWRKTKRGSSQHEESNQHVLQLIANSGTKYPF